MSTDSHMQIVLDQFASLKRLPDLRHVAKTANLIIDRALLVKADQFLCQSHQQFCGQLALIKQIGKQRTRRKLLHPYRKLHCFGRFSQPKLSCCLRNRQYF